MRSFSITYKQYSLYKIEYIMNNTIDTLPVFKTDFLQTMRVDDFKKEQRNQMRNFKLEIDKILKNEVKGGLAALKFPAFESDNFQIDFITDRPPKKRKIDLAEEKKKEQYSEMVMSKINDLEI